MMKTRLLVLTAAIAVVSLAWLSGAAAQGLFEAKPAVIGMVNIEKVWNEVNARQDMNAELQGAREELLRQKEERETQIKELQQDLEWLPEGGPEQRKKLEEVEQKSIELQGWIKYQQEKLSREEKIRYQGLYRDTLEAIAAVAEANNIDLVLYRERPPKFDRRLNTAQVLGLIGNRKMLYVREDLDITNEAITRMNNMDHDIATE